MCDNRANYSFWKRLKLSYESWVDGGLTPLERAAGLWEIVYGQKNEDCSVPEVEKLEEQHSTDFAEGMRPPKDPARFKEATKLIAGLSSKKAIKNVLIKKVHQNNLELAIVRYMAYEELPAYYASILQCPNCIDRLTEGMLYKVCKIKPAEHISRQIKDLSVSLRGNADRLTAYDRVSFVQLFIHQTVDRHLGVGAAKLIPVVPMKNALSAVRLHLSILDVLNHGPDYVVQIDDSSNASSQLEYHKPRPSTAPLGKKSWRRWRVRHLRPLSYYFSRKNRSLLRALKGLDENIPSEQFVSEALNLYANA